MAGLTIVAIPSQDDYVWRISSEKVPHLTILHLGDSDNVPEIFEYLDHVADTTLTCFWMDVVRRGTLGPENADVLFLSDKHAKTICDARAYLLQNPYIRTAYDSVEQYDGPWVPHVTLGYPATPAKPDNRDYPGITYVKFDKLALWTDEYDGPEIDLRTNDDDYVSGVAYSDGDEGFVANLLSHYGVRGMRWGVRKSEEHGGGASEDHINAITARVKVKKGGVKTLSNKELQDIITRTNLEQQYAKMSPSKVAKGKKIIVGIMNTGKTVNEAIAFINSPAGKLIKAKLTKK